MEYSLSEKLLELQILEDDKTLEELIEDLKDENLTANLYSVLKKVA